MVDVAFIESCDFTDQAEKCWPTHNRPEHGANNGIDSIKWFIPS